MFLFLFPCSLRIVHPNTSYVWRVTPAKRILPKRKNALKILKDTGRRGMVGDNDLDVDQHQDEGQHNHQWMDTLIGHTFSAAGSGGNRH